MRKRIDEQGWENYSLVNTERIFLSRGANLRMRFNSCELSERRSSTRVMMEENISGKED